MHREPPDNLRRMLGRVVRGQFPKTRFVEAARRLLHGLERCRRVNIGSYWRIWTSEARVDGLGLKNFRALGRQSSRKKRTQQGSQPGKLRKVGFEEMRSASLRNLHWEDIEQENHTPSILSIFSNPAKPTSHRPPLLRHRHTVSNLSPSSHSPASPTSHRLASIPSRLDIPPRPRCLDVWQTPIANLKGSRARSGRGPRVAGQLAGASPPPVGRSSIISGGSRPRISVAAYHLLDCFQKFKRIKDAMSRWEELQSRLLIQFSNASSIIQRLQLIQNSSNYGALKCVEGIERAVLAKQMESLQTILTTMNNTMEEFHGVVCSIQKTVRDSKQLVKVGSSQLTSKQLKQQVGVKPTPAYCLEGLGLLEEMHQSEYLLKLSLVSALPALALKPSANDDLGALQQLLVDQPNIPREEVQLVYDIIFAEEIA
ncbi:Uncharacterized protein SHERM_05431 [Striga hermonthica]|uniref:Uncharacterized protein n=1 Tax=Striga hermonthica TaxID=68872 RepID=A0A9N7NV74_STRHE|nr:Uncharacterized protein SHERM_05431 [Striga hermonthica]